mmetsp:Transcript_35768/g.71784  ORF Transcript_35768/g.71784 Transcript_35768/m.71784 type:complete len:229 (+) Transcript_35768:647-1333(+)
MQRRTVLPPGSRVSKRWFRWWCYMPRLFMADSSSLFRRSPGMGRSSYAATTGSVFSGVKIPLKARYEIRVVSSPWLVSTKSVSSRTRLNLETLKRCSASGGLPTASSHDWTGVMSLTLSKSMSSRLMNALILHGPLPSGPDPRLNAFSFTLPVKGIVMISCSSASLSSHLVVSKRRSNGLIACKTPCSGSAFNARMFAVSMVSNNHLSSKASVISLCSAAQSCAWPWP